MTYEEARQFIEEANRYGSRLGLQTVTELLKRLGNPQEKLKIIHVAGTNGKGSTTAFVSSILAAQGYLTGRYISPSVFTYREKIQLIKNINPIKSVISEYSDISKDDDVTNICLKDERNKDFVTARQKVDDEKVDTSNIGIDVDGGKSFVTEYITREGVSRAIEVIKPICEGMIADGLNHPTSFEIETAMALLYFTWLQVDFAVIEVGLGGRLDATNVFKQPVCCIITSISMDHMEYLGDTLEKIAAEKAGIIKESVPVVTCNTSPEVFSVLAGTCLELGADLNLVTDKEATDVLYTPERTAFTMDGQSYAIRLLGKYQIINALLAIKAARLIRQAGYPISDEAVKKGLLETRWRGRFEIIRREPYMVIDGAHNADAAQCLKETVEQYFSARRLIYIMGVLADKDYHSVLRITASLADVIITVTPMNNRALASGLLAAEARKYSSADIIDAGNVRQALKLAYERATKEDVILAFGSLSYLGELRDCAKQDSEDL